MTASTEAPEGEGYRRGWADAVARFREIMDAARRFGTVEMGVALADTDLEPAVAITVMRRASPLPPDKLEAADVPH